MMKIITLKFWLTSTLSIIVTESKSIKLNKNDAKTPCQCMHQRIK